MVKAKARPAKHLKQTSGNRSVKETDLIIGHRVRQRRLHVGMSQERLADLLGVTFQQVQKYEKGVNRIASSRLFDVALALDADVCSFFKGLKAKATGGADASLSAVFSTPEGAQLAKVFAGIASVKVRRNVVALVGALAEEDKRA